MRMCVSLRNKVNEDGEHVLISSIDAFIGMYLDNTIVYSWISGFG
jgi:hypothetical protein